MRFLFFFLFILCISLVSGYSAGEIITLPYNNITNTTYPCILLNDTIYLSGDVNVGDVSCDITYYEYYEEPVASTSFSGSGGVAPVCANWSECVNNKTKRVCSIPYTKVTYNQTKSCVTNITHSEESIINLTKEIIKESIPITTTINITVNQTVNDTVTQEPKQNNIITQIVLIFFGAVILLILYIKKIHIPKKQIREELDKVVKEGKQK